MYGNPTVYYADGSERPQEIFQDLKKAGYNMKPNDIIALTDNQLVSLRTRIPGILLPFIYLPAKDKINCEYVKITTNRDITIHDCVC